jgi:hypothetical protein
MRRNRAGLAGENSVQKPVLLTADGANGKSTYLRADTGVYRSRERGGYFSLQPVRNRSPGGLARPQHRRQAGELVPADTLWQDQPYMRLHRTSGQPCFAYGLDNFKSEVNLAVILRAGSGLSLTGQQFAGRLKHMLTTPAAAIS